VYQDGLIACALVFFNGRHRSGGTLDDGGCIGIQDSIRPSVFTLTK
jgi:hypothetical protein